LSVAFELAPLDVLWPVFRESDRRTSHWLRFLWGIQAQHPVVMVSLMTPVLFGFPGHNSYLKADTLSLISGTKTEEGKGFSRG
jgi:hypothetical protein